jgi:hypothetical protein
MYIYYMGKCKAFLSLLCVWVWFSIEFLVHIRSETLKERYHFGE